MRTLTPRRAQVALLSAALLVGAVACGDDTADTTDTTATAETTAAPADTAAPDTAAPDTTAAGGDTTAPAGTEPPPPAFDCATAEVEEVGGSLTIYSGRSEELVGPLLDCFEERSGTDVEIRYGGSEEMAQLIAVEGDQSPADVFFSQSPGSTGFLVQEGRLVPLPADVVGLVDPAFASTGGEWVGTSGRVRVLVYNTELISQDQLPASVFDLTDPAWAGQVGVAPSNGSFQDFISAMIAIEGEDVATAFLDGLAANDAQVYEGNSAIVEAVARGEIAVGLVNHYYGVNYLKNDPSAPIANHFFGDGDIGSIILVASVGVLDTAGDQQPQAEAFVRFLLSEAAEAYFVGTTSEYALIAGMGLPAGQPSLDEIGAPDVDLNALGGLLSQTVALIEESGLAAG